MPETTTGAEAAMQQDETIKPTAEELSQQLERLKGDSTKLSTLLKDRDIEGVKSLTAFLLIDLHELETDLLLLEDEKARQTLTADFQKIKSKVDTVQESLSLTNVPTPQQLPQIVIREPAIQRPQMKIKAATLDTFNGNIREYGAWWEMFKIGVHDCKEFDEVMKFSHLKSTLRGEAKQAVEGLGKIGNNYEKAIAELKRRFGDPTKLAAAFYDDIKTLPPNYETNGQRPTFDSIQKSLANLESIGSSIDQENLKSTVLSKFSKDTLREALRHLNYSDSEAPFSQFSVPDIMSALQKAVSLEELVDMYFSAGNDSGTQTRHPSKNRTYQNQSPVAALMNVNTSAAAHDYRAKNKKCKFCNETSHVSQECGNYRTKDKRQERLSQLNLCYVCLSDSHKAGACSSKDRPCVYCKRTGHSKFLCVNFLKEKQQRYEQSKQNRDPAVTRSNSASTPPGKGSGHRSN
ncbi:uncharacterized protein LOC135840790 [Planococcus citri]|uniref:uncharacterized protein LOC135840790 n=1 Tax=Planococcus citri TaxID=170843 RepID=UPI0031F810F0